MTLMPRVAHPLLRQHDAGVAMRAFAHRARCGNVTLATTTCVDARRAVPA
jgi:hypothetical protein